VTIRPSSAREWAPLSRFLPLIEGFFMSQTRIVRASLLLAALCLNFAPTAFAQSKDAKDPKAAPVALAPSEIVRPEVAKALDQKKFGELMAAKKFTEIDDMLKAAEAFPNRSAEEDYVISRMRLAHASTSGNADATIKYLEAVIASGRLPKADMPNFIEALGNYYYNKPNYPKAIEVFKRHAAETGNPAKTRSALTRAYYFGNDLPNAKIELLNLLDDYAKVGKMPDEKDLALLSNTAAKLKDIPTYIKAKEILITINPTDDNWSDLLKRVLVKPTFNQRLTIELFRLQAMAVKTMQADEYQELIELCLIQGFPTEAKKMVEIGYANGVLGQGSDAPKHKKLREQATKASADDIKNIAAGEASALKSKNGTGLVNLGYAYVTMDQYDKGIDLIKQGIAKGGLKAPDDAVLRLGMAYAKAGKKDEALKTFAGLKGEDGLGDLARYWTMWLNRPGQTAAAPAAPAAPAAAAAPAASVTK
jgi:tetratricopeptide (TPR) repeat protein